MGFLDFFRRSRQTPLAGPKATTSRGNVSRTSATRPDTRAGFAVIDVETTGLSPTAHRVVELAIVRTDLSGRVLDEWSTRFNPEGPVGATHIHGITQRDVAHAPRFGELIPQITSRLSGHAVVAHNAKFDLAFLRNEYARAGWGMPWLPALCTLEASNHYLPHIDRRRLVDCCWAAKVRLDGAHSALGDARGVAGLLAHYMDPAVKPRPHADHLALPNQARAVTWPSRPGGVTFTPSVRLSRAIPSVAPPAPRLTELLESFSFVDALDEGAPEGSAAYLELLAAALEDGELSDAEQAALADAAAVYELTAEEIHSANRSFLLALAHIAFDDGVISRSERAELNTTADLLGLKRTLVAEVLEHAEAARNERMSQGLRPLPKVWSLGEPLRVGDKVVFTGCDDALRDRLERRAEKLGVRVLGAVSRRVAMLVTDGGFDGTKAAAARELGTRVVSPEDFAVLLKHLQPALPRRHGIAQVTSTTEAAAPAEPQSSPVTSLGDPRAIRDWARQNGFEIGIRGRLPSHVLDAYRSRETASSN